MVSAAEKLATEAAACSDPARLRDLAAHRFTKVREQVALNPATPLEVLHVLAADKHHLPRYAVAGNPSPHALLAVFAAQDHWVRGILAQRSDLDDDTHDRLLADPEHEVRRTLAWSTRSPDLLERLASDPDPRVRVVLAYRSTTPDEVRERLSRDPEPDVRATVADSHRAPEETIQRLARDRSAIVRFAVLTEYSRRRDILQLMLDDPSPRTRRQAQLIANGRALHPSPTGASCPACRGGSPHGSPARRSTSPGS